MPLFELVEKGRLVEGALGGELGGTLPGKLDAVEKLVLGLLQMCHSVLHQVQRMLKGETGLGAAKEVQSACRWLGWRQDGVGLEAGT